MSDTDWSVLDEFNYEECEPAAQPAQTQPNSLFELIGQKLESFGAGLVSRSSENFQQGTGSSRISEGTVWIQAFDLIERIRPGYRDVKEELKNQIQERVSKINWHKAGFDRLFRSQTGRGYIEAITRTGTLIKQISADQYETDKKVLYNKVIGLIIFRLRQVQSFSRFYTPYKKEIGAWLDFLPE